jgi:hypothetical protein
MSTTVSTKEQPKPFDALHTRGEVGDRLRIGKVALEGGRGHEEGARPHQPGDCFRFGVVEAEARAELARHLGAELAMITAPPLGDIVQEDRNVEHAARGDALDDRGGKRMILLELAALDPREKPDRADRMLVDRIMMIHVELHLRDHPAEIGNEAAEDPGFVHPAQHRLRIAGGRQHVEEQGVRAGSARTSLSISFESRLAARIASGWISSWWRSASAKIWSRRTGSSAKKPSPGKARPPAVEHEAFELARAAAQRRQAEAAAGAGELLVEMREEDAGEVSHRLRVQEIMLHEALDRDLPGRFA